MYRRHIEILNLGCEVNSVLQQLIVWDALLTIRCIFRNQVVRFSEQQALSHCCNLSNTSRPHRFHVQQRQLFVLFSAALEFLTSTIATYGICSTSYR